MPRMGTREERIAACATELYERGDEMLFAYGDRLTAAMGYMMGRLLRYQIQPDNNTAVARVFICKSIRGMLEQYESWERNRAAGLLSNTPAERIA